MISVIIPAHNEGENLKKLLPYLLKIGQGHPIEVIVARSRECRDNPQEGNMDPGIICFQCKEKGRAVQMNRGALKATGHTLVFLHADVLPPKSFFKDIRETLEGGFDAGFFSYRFDMKSLFLKMNSSFTGRDGIFTGGGDQCLFIRKTIFDTLGGYDESQVIMEDFEFFKRLKKENIPYKIVQNDLIVSARKYRRNSYLRVNLSNLLLVFLFKLGYPAVKLKTLHNRLIRMPD